MLTRLRRFLAEEDWAFAPHEAPAIPGSPGSPEHPTPRRAAYGAISVLLGLTAGLGNALVSANTATLQGALGLDPAEIAWLPTVYVMTNVSINLVLIKFRQQFGLRPFALIFLAIYAAVTFAHLFVQGFASAIAVRAASGMAAAPVSSLALYYMMQALPAKWRLKAVVLGIGIPQCATPLARLFSPELLAMSQWRALYLFELGMAALSLAAVAWLRLPPTVRQKAFEPLDFVTFVLFGGSMALVAAVLGLGRIVWWTNAAWIGWALIAAIPMLAAALVIEHGRASPLLNTRWLASADILRFAIVTVMARIVLSEQSYGAIGLLTLLGQNNDQLVVFFVLMFAASAAGVVASAIVLNVEKLAHPVMLAIALVAVAAWLDSHSTSLTRAPELYPTQMLIAFAGTFFLGPSLLFGMTRALQQGAGHIISFVALFGIINGIGSLAGTALLGTYQVAREQENSAAIVANLDASDPIVAARIQAGGAGVSRVIGDPALRGAEGAALLAQTARREANVLAYDDVFRAIAVLAALTSTYLAFPARATIVARPARVGAGMTDARAPVSPTPATEERIAEAQVAPVGSGWRPPRVGPVALAVIALLVAGGIGAILAAWRLPPFATAAEQTDNAYVRGRVTVIAPQVNGYVTQVLVRDFADVRAGQVLAVIDRRIYQQRVDQAQAQVAAQGATLANALQAARSREATFGAQEAAVANAQAQLMRAQADMARVNDLVTDGSVSLRERDQTLAALRQAQAGVRQAQAAREIARQDIRTVEVGRGGQKAGVSGAEAALNLAQIDLANTVIRAPESGRLSEVGVRVGQYVTAGSQLMFLVPAETWVIANFKEAQTARMMVGQPASFTVDALARARLTGRVERIAPAAGSEFAVLKSDNATGNFTKVPQRIAVRIRVDPGQPLAARLRPGMSVEARVDTASGPRVR